MVNSITRAFKAESVEIWAPGFHNENMVVKKTKSDFH